MTRNYYLQPAFIENFCQPVDHFRDGTPIYDPACWAHVTMLPFYVACAVIVLAFLGALVWSFWP
jgi:hypothetical protein